VVRLLLQLTQGNYLFSASGYHNAKPVGAMDHGGSATAATHSQQLFVQCVRMPQ